jgi:drug/metabolite transporter (DMT)-like permease
MAIGILAVSTAAIFIRYAQLYAPSLVIAAYRLTLASLILAPFTIGRRRHELGSLQRRELSLALLSGFFLAIHFATWITSLEYTTVASSVVLVTTTPLWVALMAPFTIKEPLNRQILTGMALALVGGVIIGLSDACSWEGFSLACPDLAGMWVGNALLGDLLAVVGAVAAAVYILIGRRLRAGLSLIAYIFVVYGMAAVILVMFTLIARQPLSGYPPVAYLCFLALALVPQLIGHSSFNWALRYVSASYVSIILLGEPIGSILLAYLVLDEVPTTAKIFGAILILVGIYVASKNSA